MIKLIKILILIALCLAIVGFMRKNRVKTTNFFHINAVGDIAALFPQDAATIKTITTQAIEDARQRIDAIQAIPDDQRTYQNTVQPFDELVALSDLAIVRSTLSALEMVSPHEALRTAAHDAVQQINDFAVDALENNQKLYQALKAYAQGAGAHEKLTPDQRYFLIKTLEDYKRGGLELPDAERTRVGVLKKELAKLGQEFETNIAQDNRTITVDRAALAGLEEDFIASLPKDGKDGYVLGVDYPTYFNVMDNCIVAATRKKLYRAFNNRAYPINKANLDLVIAKRDELAHLLGFSSYAAFDLDDQMVKNPERAYTFLRELLERAGTKAQREYEQLAADLPESVVLNKEGKLEPWDVRYVQNQYKKKHFSLDERLIAQYFPMQKTVEGLLDIYRQFFSLEFKEIPATGFWHDEVTLIEVHDATTNALLGYLLLDLYPRPNKFTHACNITLVPTVTLSDSSKPAAVSLVIANFPKPTADKPALLKRDDVNTFFHEFGHALHGLLGRTTIASLSGTSVKSDFVEMPSQMLEEWLWDKEILKKISSHYQTGEPLSDALITKILELKHFDAGYWVVRQLCFALLSLDYFASGKQKDLDAILKELAIKTMPQVAFDHENRTYASFGHLMGYGAKYYGYLWSKVFALDLFATIKKEGLLNPVIGGKYVREVIGRGGSEDPNVLLHTFLGREPNQEAFLKDLGI